ncbi:GNAT family N-acetyltransferase [Paenibacillus sp. J5C_2022]|uniref:GNAT family N-acetyltransferase n=1 Tax=Paenibacillus sp. J5C2022 TaxID=2977129 RepID=UPI0021D37EB5|nr:GNAT family N-acetyltransferase [Paenibacillus sp. J5C2022]MCU6711558.1 GNAT family N-acetyltransferase [Paenibacillus sp. J5C2022]
MIKHFIDVSDQELYKFLTYCMFPNEERIFQQCKLYKTSEDRSLHGIYSKDILVGIIGLIHHPDEIEIKHIAIETEYRHKGIGQELVKAISELYPDLELIAETDKDAVDFYKKVGFTIISLGEKYPGTERFKCVYKNFERDFEGISGKA